MSDQTPSRVGQINANGAVDALWEKVFAGEILTAYDTMKKLRGTVRVRTINHGKSAAFPAIWDAQAYYHSPGTEINGQTIKHNEVIVTLDDLLIAPVAVAQIDELKNHYDVRAPYADALGRALALFEDRTIGMNIVQAARGSALFAEDVGGGAVEESDVGMSADFDASGADLITAIGLSKQEMDEAEVPVESMPVYGAFRPAQYYLMARSPQNLSTDYRGQGSLANNSLQTVDGVTIIKSNALLFGRDVTVYDASTNTDGIVKNSSGVAATGLPLHGALPKDYPTKYQADLTNTRGVVYCEPAVAYLQLMGLTTESGWDRRRQVTDFLAKMAIGMGALRSKCAREIKVS